MAGVVRRLEDRLQSSIFTFIRTVCVDDILLFAVPNAAPRTITAGTVKGIPDLILLGPRNIVVGIEIKTAKGRPSPHQDAIAEHWRALGHTYAILRSIDDARNLLRALGLRSREASQ